MLEFDASIFGGELPVGLGVVGIAVVLPGGDFVDEDLFVGNTAIESQSRRCHPQADRSAKQTNRRPGRPSRRDHRGWRAPLPRRRSTNPPANSWDRAVTVNTSNCART
jgi:hypothetical protein